MSNYYDTTPWVIPATEKSITELFLCFGERVKVKRRETVAGPTLCGNKLNSDKMLYLHSGLLAQTYVTHDANKPYAISLVLPGRVINYCGYMGIDTCSESVIALRDSEVFMLPIDEVRNRVKERTELENEIQSYCMSCIASDYDAFTCMFTCDTEKRLAHLFKSLAQSFNCDLKNEWINIPLKLSYSELSYVMYTTKKTIERILPNWRERGIVRDYKNGFEINSWELNHLL
ncbi:Crp/Fnr family transcriptional regulator [Ferrimonas sp. SCSIO 43195]|uniref:Crp/Fnr family transcriptional regulator n=1 Tax=Ferrimonas sp. SCSIO 43195 TaxID=2822844 RepID=UPI002075A47F|nr:Crp/Fnr family transcriptional regulator [Ferrimonas sp. SCSIO 43195]USD37537.1 Crp/Fnr family transcriptional regulator [Ferrimonas sp. SCSIO 43195]